MILNALFSVVNEAEFQDVLAWQSLVPFTSVAFYIQGAVSMISSDGREKHI